VQSTAHNSMLETATNQRSTFHQDPVKRKSTVSRELCGVLVELELDNFEHIFAKEGVRGLEDLACYNDDDLEKFPKYQRLKNRIKNKKKLQCNVNF